MTRKNVPTDKSLAHCFPLIAAEWDSDKNDLSPIQVFSMSTFEAWWICSQSHSYLSRVHNRTSKNKGCPFCCNKSALFGFNDLETLFPSISQLWDKEINSLSPREVVPGSGLKVWWRHEDCGHSWNSVIRAVVLNPECPYCSNVRVLQGFNDLATLFPNLMSEWDYHKNVESPDLIHAGSPSYFWWVCDNEHSWRSQLWTRTRLSANCKECYLSSRVSRLENEIASFVKSMTKLEVRTSEHSVISPYEIDIFLPALKIGFEVNGNYWHSDEILLKKIGLTANEYHQRKLSLAAAAGVDLYFIWESDWRSNQFEVRKSVEAILNKIDLKGYQLAELRKLHMTLTKTERSRVAELASRILEG